MVTYLKKATASDLPIILAIYTAAEKALAHQQIPQWQNGTGPSATTVVKDIHTGCCYLLMEQQQVIGVASLSTEKEEAYEQITEGYWKKATNDCYTVIHRVAVHSDYKGQGMAETLITALLFVSKQHKHNDIRIDTHPKNLPMQKLIKKVGFHYRGRLLLPITDGERLAYQLILN